MRLNVELEKPSVTQRFDPSQAIPSGAILGMGMESETNTSDSIMAYADWLKHPKDAAKVRRNHGAVIRRVL